MVKIRVACKEDIDLIMMLEHECFDQDNIEGHEVYLERIKVFCDGFLLMFDDEEFIGAICSELWDSNGHDISYKTFQLGHSIATRHNNNNNELYISSIGIMPKHRGKGYAKHLLASLLNSIINKYPMVDRSILIVSENWIGARRIYTRFGFETLICLDNFFGGVIDPLRTGIVMTRKLDAKSKFDI